MASWLPQTPAQSHAIHRAPASSTKHRGIFATAWSKVKRSFGRSSAKKGGRARSSTTEGGELLATAGPSLPFGAAPGRAAVLHTTGSAPTPAATLSTAFVAGPAGSQSRIPKPPLGSPGQGGRSASSQLDGSAHSSASGSRLPQAAPPAPMGQPPLQQWMAAGKGGASPDPVRRLAFSPAATAIGRAGAPASTQPVPIAAGGPHTRQGPPPGWQQQAQQQRPASGQLPPLPPRPQQAGGPPAGSLRRAGSMPETTNGSCCSLPTPYATAPLPHGSMRSPGLAPPGSSWGSTGGFAAQQLQLLGVPARSGLAGRWLREGGLAEGDGGAEVDFVLQIPQLQAAAREATRHLKVGGRWVGCHMVVLCGTLDCY